MPEPTVRSILRIASVLTMLVGAILTTQTLLAQAAVSRSLASTSANLHVEASGMLGTLGGYAIAAQALTIGWGVLLYYSSDAFARHITR